MVRWGTVRGIGSFSTTVPEKACTGGKEQGNFHGGSEVYREYKRCISAIYSHFVTGILRLFQCTEL